MRLVIASALALAAGAATAQPVANQAVGEAVLSVEAEGEYLSRPDTMTITAGTVTTGVTAAEAVRANAALAQRLIAAVRAAGIAPRDVRTSRFSVQPRFENDRDDVGRDGRPPRILGYVTSNQFEIRLRDLNNAEALIARLFETGANSVRGPVFSLADDTSARRAAERAAIAAARAEAENYASALGKRVGRLLRVPDRRTETNRYGDEIIVSGSRIARTPIEPGEIETKSSVFVDFALVDR